MTQLKAVDSIICGRGIGFTSGKYQILCKTDDFTIFPVSGNFVNFCKLISIVRFVCKSSLSIAAFWRMLMSAPLRRIISRELDVQQVKPKYSVYAIIDELECGHSYWSPISLLELVNAYETSPAISAKRHRCRPCMNLLAKRKPMQTVTDIAAAKTA